MQFFCILIVFVFFFSLVKKTELTALYIDCDNGEDTNLGTFYDPIKTISKLNSLISIGLDSSVDELKMKNGCVFKDSFQIDGVENVRVTNYGQNDENIPEINLSKEIDTNSWTEYSSIENAYFTNIDATTLGTVKYVYAGEKKYNMTHFPSNAMEEYFYTSKKQDEKSPVIDVNQKFFDETRGKDLSNVEFVIRSKRWAMHKTTIIGMNESNLQLTLEDPGNYSPFYSSSGFLLMNKLWMLEFCTGCFYFDSTAERLYLKIDSEKDSVDPKNHQISIVTDDTSNEDGIKVQYSRNVTIENIKINKVSSFGIVIDNNNKDITFRNGEIDNCGQKTGLLSGENIIFESNIVSNAGFDGLTGIMNGGSILNNEITNIFSNGVLDVPFSGNQILGRGIIVSCTGETCKMQRNRLENIGYVGLALGGKNWKVTNNLIKRCCYRTDDCGAIYFWAGTPEGTGKHYIADNMILDSKGNSFGTSSYDLGLRYEGAGQGIYPDDRTANSVIVDNVIADVNLGIQVHNSKNNIILRNLVFRARKSAFYITEDTIVNIPGFCSNNSVKENLFHTLDNQTTFYAKGNLGHTEFFEELDDNIYYQQQMYLNDYATGFSEWRELLDSNGYNNWSKNPRSFGGENFVSVPYLLSNASQNMITNPNFEKGIEHWRYWGPNPSKIIHSWNVEQVEENGKIVNQTSLKSEINATAYCLAIISPTFEIKKGTAYVLEFDYWSEKSQSISVIVRRSFGDYATIGFSEDLHPTTQRQSFRKVFTGLEDEESSRIDFGTNDLTGTFYLANVVLTSIELSTHDEEYDYTFLHNEDLKEPKTIILDQSYCDEDGNIYEEGSILVLEPLKAKLFTNCFCNNDSVCNNFENANTCPSDCLPKCGNGVCERATETWINCPEDCLDYTALVFGITVPSVIIAAFFVVFCFLIGIIIVLICILRKKIKRRDEKSGEFEMTYQ